ncbi:MAG TPA: hypothetical protein VIQ03_03070 [Gammaproteobacteria bacterium]
MKIILKSRKLFLMALVFGMSLNAYAATDLSKYTAAMQQLEADLDIKSGDTFKAMLDVDTLLSKIFEGIENDVDPSFKQGFSKGFKERGVDNLVERIVGMMPDQNGANVIRVIEKDGKIYAAVRYNFQDQGYGYVEYELVKDKASGKIRIVDWYDYQSGQNYSKSLKQIVATLSPNPNLIGKIFDIATGQSSRAQDIVKMVKAANEQDFKTIRTIYKSFDSAQKKNWVIMIVSFNLANTSGDIDFYDEVLIDIEKNFANDPRASFVLIDYYILKQQYDEALACINKLSRIFDYKDAGLWHLTANTHLMQGNYQRSIKDAQQGIKLEPDFEESYWTLLSAQVMTGDNASATDTIKILEQDFGYLLSREALSQDEIFQEYINSPEYKKLESSR